MRPEPPDFDPMFQAGARYRLPDPAGTVAVVEVHDAGLLHLPTGRLVACDPFWGSQVRRQVAPFTVTVPPGRYPVTLSLARGPLGRPDPVPRLGAAANLTIRDKPVVAWEVALHPGEDPERLQPEQIYTLGVDSGHAGLLDASAVGALAALGEPGSELDRLFEQVWGNEWVNLVVDQVSGLNVVVFHGGLGDGGYATWMGRGVEGEPVCLLSTCSCSRTASARSLTEQGVRHRGRPWRAAGAAGCRGTTAIVHEVVSGKT